MLIKKPDTFKQLTESCLPNADTLDMQQLSGDQRRAAAAAFFSGRSRVIANNWNKNYIQLGIKYSRGVQCRQGILNQENREIQVKKSWWQKLNEHQRANLRVFVPVVLMFNQIMQRILLQKVEQKEREKKKGRENTTREKNTVPCHHAIQPDNWSK